MSNEDKLNAVAKIRYEPFFGGSTIVMSIDEARDQFGCVIEAFQVFRGWFTRGRKR